MNDARMLWRRALLLIMLWIVLTGVAACDTSAIPFLTTPTPTATATATPTQTPTMTPTPTITPTATPSPTTTPTPTLPPTLTPTVTPRALTRTPTPVVSNTRCEPSGVTWARRYAMSRSTTDLVAPFRANVERFIAALRAAGADVFITETWRSRERAYLMHYAYRIAREELDPRVVPPLAGVNICWAHTNAKGQFDLAASQTAALQMTYAYQIVYTPKLNSRHIEGRAIDMTIVWDGTLIIRDSVGNAIAITSQPRTGAGNAQLHKVGLTYGVIKLVGDAPHWSDDGN